MCLPKCGRPDGPRCYKIPRKVVPDAAIFRAEHTPDVHNTTNFHPNLQVSHASPKSLHDSVVDDFRPPQNNPPVCDKQAQVRREKSRIAAKIRRQKENQALVKLRLTLPIKSYKLTDMPTHTASTERAHIGAGSTLDTNALNTVVTYRTANALSRHHHHHHQQQQQQQQLAAPEFEKAVTIRLAANSLCLYNWLYPNHLTGSRSVRSSRTQLSTSLSHLDVTVTEASALPNPTHYSTTFGPTLPSQSLVMVIVDTTENTVVFASPSYCRLIGLSWNTTIGLQLSELRVRQYAALAAAAHTSVVLKNRFTKTTHSHACCTDHCPSRSPSPGALVPAYDHHFTMTDNAPSLRLALTTHASIVGSGGSTHQHTLLSSWLDQSLAAVCSTWPTVSHYPHSSQLLTTLLPPPTASSPVGDMSDDTDNRGDGQHLTQKRNVYAICWTSQCLPSPADSNPLWPHTTPPSPSLPRGSSNLRVLLFHPIVLFPSPPSMLECSTDDTSCVPSVCDTASSPKMSLSLGDPIGLIANVRDATGGVGTTSATDLTTSPRSFHMAHNLRFADADKSFLSALGWSQSELSGYSLLDLVHPDDLFALVTALNCVTDSQPVITGMHRLRSASGVYRWSRLLAFVLERNVHSLWPDHAAYSIAPPSNSHSHDYLDPSTTTTTGAATITTPTTPISVDQNSTGGSTCAESDLGTQHPSSCRDAASHSRIRLLACCHQLAHFSTARHCSSNICERQSSGCDPILAPIPSPIAPVVYDNTTKVANLCIHTDRSGKPSPDGSRGEELGLMNSDYLGHMPVQHVDGVRSRTSCYINLPVPKADHHTPHDVVQSARSAFTPPTSNMLADLLVSSTGEFSGHVDDMHLYDMDVGVTTVVPARGSHMEQYARPVNCTGSREKVSTECHDKVCLLDVPSNAYWLNRPDGQSGEVHLHHAPFIDPLPTDFPTRRMCYSSGSTPLFTRPTSTDTGISMHASNSDVSATTKSPSLPEDSVDSVSDWSHESLPYSWLTPDSRSPSVRRCPSSQTSHLIPQAEVFAIHNGQVVMNDQSTTLPVNWLCHSKSGPMQMWYSDQNLSAPRRWSHTPISETTFAMQSPADLITPTIANNNNNIYTSSRKWWNNSNSNSNHSTMCGHLFAPPNPSIGFIS